MDAASHTNKHGYIIGGDLNTSPWWLTSVMENNRALFFRQQRRPRMIFSPAKEAKHGDFAVAWLSNADSPVDAPLVKADSSHDTVFTSWPRLRPYHDGAESQVLLTRDQGAHQSPAEPQSQPEPQQSRRTPHAALEGNESAEELMPWQVFDQRSRAASERGVTAMVATATAAVPTSSAAAFQGTPAQSSSDLPHGITSEHDSPSLSRAGTRSVSVSNRDQAVAPLNQGIDATKPIAAQCEDLFAKFLEWCSSETSGEASESAADYGNSEACKVQAPPISLDVSERDATCREVSINTPKHAFQGPSPESSPDGAHGMTSERGSPCVSTIDDQCSRDQAAAPLIQGIDATTAAAAQRAGPSSFQINGQAKETAAGYANSDAGNVQAPPTSADAPERGDATLPELDLVKVERKERHRVNSPRSTSTAYSAAPMWIEPAKNFFTETMSRTVWWADSEYEEEPTEATAGQTEVWSASVCIVSLLTCMAPSAGISLDDERCAAMLSEDAVGKAADVLKEICMELFWLRTHVNVLERRDITRNFSELFRLRRLVQPNDHVELSDEEIARCWNLSYDDFCQSLRPQQARLPAAKKRSHHSAYMKKQFGKKHFVLALWQTGLTWTPDCTADPNKTVNDLLAWCIKFRNSQQAYKENVHALRNAYGFQAVQRCRVR